MAVGIAVRVPISVAVDLDTLSLYTAQAMYEIAEAVGCKDCKHTIEMGVVKRHIIEKMMIRFIAIKNEKETIVGEIILSIDWERAQLLAEGSLAQELASNFGNDQAFIPQVTHGFLPILERIASRLKTERGVTSVRSSYRYRSEYNSGEKYDEAMKYLGHVHGKEIPRDTMDLNNALKMELDALKGMFNVTVRY